MKKILTILLIAMTVLFTACDKENQKTITGLSIKPTELILTPGSTSRLSVVVTPENAKYNTDDFVWTSSDTTVAVVSRNGIVTAIEKGVTNISVTYKDFTSVCQLTVRDWIENLTFTGVYFGVADTSAYGDELDTIQSLAGETYYTKRVDAVVLLFTAGFYLNDDYNFAGSNEGGVVEGHGPMWWAPGWANGTPGGTIFCLGEWYIYDTLMNKCLLPGETNEQYIYNMNLFLENVEAGDQTTAYTINMKAAGEDGCEGATMTHYVYHTTAEGYGSDGYYSAYVPELFFNSGYFYAENNYVASNTLCSIEGHHFVAKELRNENITDTDFYFYGCYWHYDTSSETYSWIDQDVHFGETYVYDYNIDIFESEAPARNIMKITNFGNIQTTQKIMNKIHSIPIDNIHEIK